MNPLPLSLARVGGFVSLIEYIDYKQHMEESWPMRQYKFITEMVKSSASNMVKNNSGPVIDKDDTGSFPILHGK